MGGHNGGFMSKSYCHLATHIIFATDERAYHLNQEQQDEMHKYIGGIISHSQGIPLQINGTLDHIHILCIQPKEMCISDLVRNIKAYSSKWFNEKYHSRFHWQTGYAAYSVSKSNEDRVNEYIVNQKKHHEKVSFMEEYRKFLEMHGLKFEE